VDSSPPVGSLLFPSAPPSKLANHFAVRGEPEDSAEPPGCRLPQEIEPSGLLTVSVSLTTIRVEQGDRNTLNA
jgi:hypothetical protein